MLNIYPDFTRDAQTLCRGSAHFCVLWFLMYDFPYVDTPWGLRSSFLVF